MIDIPKQIEDIEEIIRKTPHHKGTNSYLGILRARIARLKDKQLEGASRKSGGGGGYAVKKQGDATVILVGPPSAGKSTLINRLTNAESKVAAYAFTTVSVIPGMMKYKNAYIQILDVPGLIEGAQEGKGRGREVLAVARNSDLIIFMTDPERLEFFAKLVRELEHAGIRINKKRPEVKVEKKIDGGLMIHTNLKQDIDKETIKEVAAEFGIKNGDITINEKLTMDRLIDSFAKNRVYIPAIYVVNKSDTLKSKDNETLDQRILRISAERNSGLDNLRDFMWQKLQFVTIYLTDRKSDSELPDEPKIIKTDSTLQDVIDGIGAEFAKGKKTAKIWGNGAKFEGQEVSLSTKVQDGMMIKFI